MGVNIIVYKIIGSELDEFDPEYPILERQDWFDSLRYSGDKDFVLNNQFDYVDKENELVRPQNFDNCRQWIDDNLILNHERMIDCLSRMQNDTTLVFRFSW